jgi:hypothetical protein
VGCNFNDDDGKKSHMYMGVNKKKLSRKSAFHAAGSEEHKAVYNWVLKLLVPKKRS